ncbi:CobW family GTP-binding protein [Pantoea sp. AS142]|uniref:CobW family GTP-binding protein n=1 Tax=Pantoea sp. AS142 TaxID=3081292 RepID=UPI00301A850B
MTRVNLITGFLGSGKTTLLCHLLAARPPEEKWAVLVNEFGEIGIDGALLADRGATLKEIPGGCLCCVNGLPMQVGLNMLLNSKPDRLLIEPTGLGHPRQVLQMLSAPVYQTWLQLNATLTLLDARQLSEPRIVANESFRDQLIAADIIIANKRDCWDQEDHQRLADWQLQMQPPRPLLETEFGQIPLSLLDTPYQPRDLPLPHHHHPAKPASGLAAIRLDGEARWRRALNYGQGYSACGWLFDGDTLFDSGALLEWVRQAPVDRVKGVMRTTEGTLRINCQANELQSKTLASPPPDSRIEIIHSQQADWNRLQSALLKCRLR